MSKARCSGAFRCGCVVILALVGIAVLAFCSGWVTIKDADAQRTTFHHTGEQCTLAETTSGYKSRETIDRLMEYKAQEDKEAFTKVFRAAEIDGEIVTLIKGDSVVAIDVAIFAELARVRRKGELEEYWVMRSALSK